MLKYKLPYCILENNCIFALAKVFQNGQLFKTEDQKSFPKSETSNRNRTKLIK